MAVTLERACLWMVACLVLAGGCKNQTGRGDACVRETEIQAAASRTSGVAPLGVFFNADIVTQGCVMTQFHDLEHAWDFGDGSSGTWATFASPKNNDKGPVAAHVFETPGDHTVTLSVRDASGVIATKSFQIQVGNPEEVYSGANTICLSAGTTFDGCPTGATKVTTADITDIRNQVATGKRILLRRGDTWTTSGAGSYEEIAGPVTIGAFGDCTSPDDRGICANAPLIQMNGSTETGLFSLGKVHDWRFQDLSFSGNTSRWGVIGGATDLTSILLLRLKVIGFQTPLGTSFWETKGHDQLMIVNSDVSETEGMVIYIGSERLALMGNQFRNSSTTHILRVWQAYLGVISHNVLSGSSLDSTDGRHALKLHGPDEGTLARTDAAGLANPTRFVVVSDNLFGGSGPWPVAVGPQDSGKDERLRDVLIEKNRFFSGYGELSSTLVQVALEIWARDVTVRNNVFDGIGSERYYTAISVSRRGVEPPPSGIRIFNNTIYKSDGTPGYSSYSGINVASTASTVIAKNNLIAFPSSGTVVRAILNESSDLVDEHNLFIDDPKLVDPDNGDALARDYRLQESSPARDAGGIVPVLDDLLGVGRPQGAVYDVGAIEWQ